MSQAAAKDRATAGLVQKLWNLCHILRDDGITYQDYVTELTWLLFLKMMEETGAEDALPKGYRWRDLASLSGVELMNFYRKLLLHLGTKTKGRVQVIFADAATHLRQPKNLRKLVKNIDSLEWHSVEREQLGDLYEGLLEKNAGEKKSGAGQYFTPRPLIESMVAMVRPIPGEVVQDPAAGTGGFLIEARRAMLEHRKAYDMAEKEYERFQRGFYGMELVPDTHRLCLMNALLHGIEGDIRAGDALSPQGAALPPADVILTNPPFGTKKGGGRPTREDFTFETSNKQLAFLQHIYRGLKPGGRAAVVLPDNVLFEGDTGTKIRRDLMDKCDLHTILRLPTGIFYAQGVKTNVLFFHRAEADDSVQDETERVWIYDLRTNMPSFGKRTPLTREHFAEFEEAFGADPLGGAPREDQGESGRFRAFTREEIRERDDNLDISWLRDENAIHHDDLEEPEVIAEEILEKLQEAVGEMEALLVELEGV